MNLVNKEVIHRTFGKGNIINHSENCLEVNFSSGTKRFVYPDVFGKYMSLVDKQMSSIIEEKIEVVEEKRRKKALQLENKRKIEEERREILRQENSTASGRSHPASQTVFWCQPEELEEIFNKWKIFVGRIKSGKKKGEPRRLARININSACLLTTRSDDDPEKDRKIVGLYMIDNNSSADGYILARKKYKIRLSEQESDKLLFWNYYINKRDPERIVWKSGRQRYFDNIWMAQILRDIVSLRNDSEEKEDAQGFYEYFCNINSINMEQLPESSGGLLI